MNRNQHTLLSSKKDKEKKEAAKAASKYEKSTPIVSQKKQNFNNILHVASNGILESLILEETHLHEFYVTSPYLSSAKFIMCFWVE